VAIQFCCANRGKLLLYVRVGLGVDAHSAEDIVQKSLYALLRRWTERENEERPIAFLYGIARFMLRDERRRDARHPSELLVLDQDSCVGDGNGIDECAGQAIANLDLAEAFKQKLTPRQRQVVYLVCIAGLTVEEICVDLGLDANTVRRHLREGRERIRRYLTDDGDPQGGRNA
jgi:RNA polymerase sigma-70 factor (ECF subfamily)